MLPLTLIAAVARNRVIGRDRGMPWRLPGDMAHFRAATMGKPVLVGRRTFATIGRPLQGRDLIVVTHQPETIPAGVEACADIDAALSRADELGRRSGASELMVAGGATLYEALMPRASTLLLTEIDLEPEGDTLFPPTDPALWSVAERQEATPVEGDTARYAFVRYVRRA